jgi:secreted trypsin-like serine protease
MLAILAIWITIGTLSTEAARLRGQRPSERLAMSNTTRFGLVPKIVGGISVSSQSRYPFMALIYDSQRRVMCGAAMIAHNAALTAAHCTLGSVASYWRVFTYRRDKSQSTAEEGGIRYTVNRIITHPNYNDDSLVNDLAILVLDAAENFGTFTPQWIDINRDPLAPAPGSITRVMGWGVTAYRASSTPNILQEVDIETASRDVCRAQLGYGVSDNSHLCAGSPGKDSCQGDSGGPLAQFINGRWVLVGLVSFGTAGCADPVKYLAVYSRISELASWIDERMREVNGGASDRDVTATETIYVTETQISTTTATVRTTATIERWRIRTVTRRTLKTVKPKTIWRTRTIRVGFRGRTGQLEAEDSS